MADPDWRHAFLRLAPGASLKRLEEPFLYHVQRDELYELDEVAVSFLSRCDGTTPGGELTADGEFVAYCLTEGLLEPLSRPSRSVVAVGIAPVPSLRYLELQLLHRCNLRCRHCYLGPPRSTEMPLETALAIAGEFASAGGLRLIISGGEPLLHPRLVEFTVGSAGLGLRRIVLTNGTLITPDLARRLDVEEIQVSLDGWQGGHDLIRGDGTFTRTIAGIRAAREAGIPVGLATLVHRGNLAEFAEMARFAAEIGAVEWGVDIPCITGELAGNPDLLVPYAEAAPFLAYGYGGGYHGSGEGYACGRHLMTVLPDGSGVKCGFYEDKPLGDARTGLMNCWRRVRHVRLDELECRGCAVLDECAGGCRFRARSPLAPDEAMCALYGVQSGPGFAADG